MEDCGLGLGAVYAKAELIEVGLKVVFAYMGGNCDYHGHLYSCRFLKEMACLQNRVSMGMVADVALY